MSNKYVNVEESGVGDEDYIDTSCVAENDNVDNNSSPESKPKPVGLVSLKESDVWNGIIM